MRATLLAGLLCGGMDAHAAPQTRDSLDVRPDPAILWTFDSGG